MGYEDLSGKYIEAGDLAFLEGLRFFCCLNGGMEGMKA